MGESEMNDMGQDVFFPWSDRGMKLELERVDGEFESPVELVPHKQILSKSSNTSACSSLSALEQIGNLMDNLAKTEHPK